MTRYYLHLNNVVDGILTDDEGISLSDLDAAREEAFGTARELIADAVETGREMDIDAIIIADDQGHELDRVYLKAVLPRTLRADI